MAKYIVRFIKYTFEEISVSCHRDDAAERAIDEYLEEFKRMPVYDDIEVEEVKP